jgi:hypothetical protein
MGGWRDADGRTASNRKQLKDRRNRASFICAYPQSSDRDAEAIGTLVGLLR